MSVRLDTRKLDKLITGSEAKADQVVRRFAMQITGDAAQHAPVETGALRASILANSPEKVGRLTYRVQDGVEYGIYQELGTSRMAAHPFLVPAVEKFREAFFAAFKELFA